MSPSLTEEIQKNRHLHAYLQSNPPSVGETKLIQTPPSWDEVEEDFNYIYPSTESIYIHVFKDTEGEKRYNVIEPLLEEDMQEKIEKLKSRIYEEADYEKKIEYREELREIVTDLFDEVVVSSTGLSSKIFNKNIKVEEEQIPVLKYYIVRDMVDYGILDPILNDEYLEDINCVGTNPISVFHKTFGMMQTNVSFDSERALENFLKKLSQRMGSPVGESHPIVDSALPEGSRINIVYPEEVSTQGRSFTIRKFPEDPISVTELINWETLSPQLAGYLWLCLENNMSIFFCGESGCGKTTTLNACLPFIPLDSKIYSVEDTPEVTPPHDNWQQLLVREEGPEEDQVNMFDLLKAALRSRPDYITPSEIRGEEGRVAFQAMQTGHPVVSTFHSSSIHRMIQRLTGDPINIPITFIDNLNVAVVQRNIKTNGAIIRRVTDVGEILGYSEEEGGVMMRKIFERDPIEDELIFRGMYNSYILEDKVAQIQGYADPKEIYDEMEERAEFLQELANKQIFDYDDASQLIDEYHRKGREGVSIRI